MFEYLNKKRVLLTGAGTLAHGLASKLHCELAIYSRNEANQFSFKEEFKDSHQYLGDICDYERLTYVVRDFAPDVIIHTAAAKRVDIAQKEPINTIQQNIVGTLNVGEIAIRNGVEALIGIGTDKECSPQTIYGYSKTLGSAALLDYNRLGDTKFSIVRYGNILCSRSSLGVIWLNAARQGKKLKITNPKMTRFWFTIDEGVKLIEYGLNKTLNTHDGHGKIYSTEMCAGTLEDFANAIKAKYNVEAEIIGNRVVEEKLHETLISESDIKDTIKTEDCYSPFYQLDGTHYLNYFITSPGSNKSNITTSFTSENAPQLSSRELLTMLEWAAQNTYQG